MEPIRNTFQFDDLCLQKLLDRNKAGRILSFIDEQNKKPLSKTASTDSGRLIELFGIMLQALSAKHSNELKEVMSKLSKTEDTSNSLTKQAINKNSSDRKDDIKIVSKNIKDSHYQIDISKDTIVRSGKRLYMVSCYARDAYLGRYLIKRNFLYTIDREAAADEAYDEILMKIKAIKNRYYEEIIDVPALFTQIKKTLDGVISEIKMEEDSISTNINRIN